MSGDVPKKPGLRYSDSPHAPDWARDPSLRSGNQITSFGQPILQVGEESPGKPPELQYSDSPFAPEWARHHSERKPKPPPEPDEPFRPSVEWFEDLLWKEASDDVRVYCIMDGYWAKGLYGRLLASPDISWAHMFQGDVALNNIQDAPFIIALKRGHKLLRWLIEEGWGDGWGIYFTASTKAALDRYGKTTRLPPDMTPSNEEKLKLCNLVEGIEDPLWLMRRHFRRFSDVEFEDDGRIVDFRYYDPAVLKTYLRSCNKLELFNFCALNLSFISENRVITNFQQNSPSIYYFKYTIYSNEIHDQNFKGYKITLKFTNNAIRVDTITPIEQLPSAAVTPERGRNIFPLIRTEQRLELKKDIEQRFINKFSETIFIVLTNQNISYNKKYVRKYINKQYETSKQLGLFSEDEVAEFIICTMLFGPNFWLENSAIREILQSRNSPPPLNMAKILKEFRENYSQQGVR